MHKQCGRLWAACCNAVSRFVPEISGRLLLDGKNRADVHIGPVER